MTERIAHGVSLVFAFGILFVAAPRGCATADASPQPVQRSAGNDPSVRRGSTRRPAYIFVGGGYYGGK